MSTRAVSAGSTAALGMSPASSMVFESPAIGTGGGGGTSTPPPAGSSAGAGASSSTSAAAAALRAPWKRDEAVATCERCCRPFTFYRRRHHCRSCGGIFCAECASTRTTGISGWTGAERVCKICQSMAPAVTLAAQPRERHVVILGSPGVGKSSIAQLFSTIGQSVTAATTGGGGGVGSFSGAGGGDGNNNNNAASVHPGPSAGASNSTRRLFRHRSGLEFVIVLEDTIGQGQVGSFPPAIAVAAHAFLLVYGVDDRASLLALRSIYQRMLDCGCYFQPVLVVGTVRSESSRVVPSDEARAVAHEVSGGRYLEIGFNSHDVGAVFDRLLDDVASRE